MNAKQRALNIWESYYKNIPNMSVKDATQCAIIHVKGIIDCLDRLDFSLEIDYEVKYWQQVLTELNQM